MVRYLVVALLVVAICRLEVVSFPPDAGMGLFVHRLCVDGYEYVAVSNAARGELDIVQSFKRPSHSYGGANPKPCVCSGAAAKKKGWWK
jgi:hypothetical protein